MSAGRVTQKLRTRTALVDACRSVIASGGPVTMPAVACAAGVSEPTAYRYFPDLISMLEVALVGMWPSPQVLLAEISGVTEPVERVRFAADVFFRRVLSHQGAARAMIAATVARPALVSHRPGLRFGLIDEALMPLRLSEQVPAARLRELTRDLAGIISADALFAHMDLGRLSPDDAVTSLVRTAGTVTWAAVAASYK